MRIVIDPSQQNQCQSDSIASGSPPSLSGSVNSPAAGPCGGQSTQGSGDSATNSQEIDLYDENIVHDFSCAKNPDLLDDCLVEMGSTNAMADPKRSPIASGPLNERNPPAPQTVSEFCGQGGQKWIYIGNLTWWTSDEDIEDALHGIGIFNLIELRIADNKPNGLSKGYCEVSLQSEKSVNEIQTRLGKIHDRVPLVLPKTRDTFTQLEGLAASVAGFQFSNTPINKGRSDPFNRATIGFSRPVPAAVVNCQVTEQNLSIMTVMMDGRLLNQMYQSNDANNNGMGMQLLPTRGFAPRSFSGPPFCDAYQPRQQMHRPRFGQNQYYSKHNGDYFRGSSRNLPLPSNPPFPIPNWRLQYHQPMEPMHPDSFPPNRPPLLHRPPGPGQVHLPPPMVNFPINDNNAFNLHSPARVLRELHSPIKAPPPSDTMIAEAHEDLMARNRIVSSSAIERAVKDAASGEFASAIETLVTAISLLKQSRVASDDRCKILITSLQDTLHGVESRSYGGSRRRSRSRSRSPVARHHSSSSQSHRYFHDTHGYERSSRPHAHERYSASHSRSRSRRSRTLSPSRSKGVSRNFCTEHDP